MCFFNISSHFNLTLPCTLGGLSLVSSFGNLCPTKILSVDGKNIGIAYQIRDDLLDWKNEDKLFNMLIKKSLDPRDVFDKMEEMLKEYSEKARAYLRKLPDNDAKINLQNLVKFTSFKV